MLNGILKSFDKVVESKSGVTILLICGIFGFLIYALQVLTVVVPSLHATNMLAESVDRLAATMKVEMINRDTDTALLSARINKLQNIVVAEHKVPVTLYELSVDEINAIEKNVLKRYERLKIVPIVE